MLTLKIILVGILSCNSIHGSTPSNKEGVFYLQPVSPSYTTGKVFHNSQPLNQVTIFNISRNSGTTSDSAGNYKIMGMIGDTLKFSYVGMSDVSKIVPQNASFLNIIMESRVEKLNEVLVVKNIRKSQKDLAREYNSNKQLIKSRNGILDKETAGYSLYILSEGEFNQNAPDLATAISGRFPSIRGGNRTIYNSNPNVLYDIDGLVMSDPSPISPALIERIAFISGLRAVALYGLGATAGVIIINTKVANYSPKSSISSGRDLLKNNIYENDAIFEEQLNIYLPSSLKLLYKSKTLNEAKEIYMQLSSNNNESKYFHIDAYNYFKSNWEETSFADSVIKDRKWFTELTLKPIAYYAESHGDFDNAIEYFKLLLQLNPNMMQSYWNLSSAYESAGLVEDALKILVRCEYLVGKNYFPEANYGIHNIINRDVQKFTDSYLNENGTTQKANDEFQGSRIIIEWNDPTADFDLQFVNPQNGYFIWNYQDDKKSSTANRAKIEEYFSEEFLIDAEDKGTWLVNLKFKRNSSLNPLYVRVIVYSNYGKPIQKKESKVFRINEKNINRQLLEVKVD